ncbi:mitogen-activated protein kinase [Orobanche minor]
MAQEKVLSSCMHLNQFISWKLDPKVARKVEHTCFGKFLAQKQIKQNLNMITAIVHFYSEADGCFSFRGQSKKNFLLDIGPEDILYITGLPINGIQVSGVESEDVVAIIQQHLGLDENGAKALFMEKGDKKCFGIHLNKLKNRFQTVPEELGSIDNYAWGAAALAVLKHSVASAKKKMIQKRVTSIGGFTYALMVFALERFPCLREGFPRSTTFPLFLGWTEILSLPFKDTQNLTTVDQYREKLENMKKDHVDWQPYGLPERWKNPYLNPLHDVRDEPVCTIPFNFDFEQHALTEEQMKELVYREDITFNPQY